jgi:hypothetical protein
MRLNGAVIVAGALEDMLSARRQRNDMFAGPAHAAFAAVDAESSRNRRPTPVKEAAPCVHGARLFLDVVLLCVIIMSEFRSHLI